MKIKFLLFGFLLCRTISLGQQETHFFHTEHFGIEDGLHQGAILDFQVDKRDFLWVHTLGSLQIFDGKNFITPDHDIQDPALSGRFSFGFPDDLYFLSHSKLYVLPADHLRPTESKVLNMPLYDRKNHSTYFLYENLTHLFIWHPNDTVYQINKHDFKVDGAFRMPVKGNDIITISELSPRNCLPDQIEFIGEDHSLYLYDLKTGRLVKKAQYQFVSSATKLSKDTIAILEKDSLHILTPDQQLHFPLPDSIHDFYGIYLMPTAPGRLLVGLRHSIYEFNLHTMKWDSRIMKTGDGNLYNLITRRMKKDSGGNMYFLSFDKGLVKLYPRNSGFEYIGAEGKVSSFVKCIEGSDVNNIVLMGTLQNGLLIFDTLGSLRQQILDFPGGETNRFISNIIKVSESRFIILAKDAYQLDLEDDSVKIKRVARLEDNWTSYYDAPFSGYTAGQFFISSYDGLLDIKSGMETKIRFIPDHALNRSSAVTKFRQGYISSAGDSLKLFDASMQKVTATFAIPHFALSRSIISQDENHVLLGTDVGLYLIEIGKQAKVVKRIYDNMVYAILPGDLAGEFWFSTDYGLFRLKPDGQIINYSIENGLQDNEFNTNSRYKSSSGKLYFGGVKGINSFYPGRIKNVTDTIRPFISLLSINTKVVSRYIATQADRKYNFSHKENNIIIEFLGKGTRSPERYNYQYFIKELHATWVDIGRERHMQFHLAPGNYTIYYHVDDAFDANAIPTHFLKICIQPPFYKRWWFLCMIALLLTAFAFYLLQLHKKRQELKLRYEFQLGQRLQNERMRISRELHDNIGAQMATVKRNINFLINQSHQLTPDLVTKKMKDLESISTQINQELRDTIWAAQNEHITMADFITRIKNYIFQVLGPESQARVLYEEHCEKQVILGPFLALNLHRICQETINNIMKHAGATEIKLIFEGDEDQCKVTILDNGKGYNEVDSNQGYGLQNIRYRAGQIGAILHFNRIGSGSSLEVLIQELKLSNNTKEG